MLRSLRCARRGGDKVGKTSKKSAGHLLDGQEWRQIPEVKQSEVKRVVKR